MKQRSKILFLLLVLAPFIFSDAAVAPDYSIVIGREDKHSIVRYDQNSEIFKKNYYNINLLAPHKGTWSINYLGFVALDNLPAACQVQWKKKAFYANIAAEINGKCEHWEFNQGHIWRLKTGKSGKMEEVYTFKFFKGFKKFCLKFTSYEEGKEGDFSQATKFKKDDVDHDCVNLITYFVNKTHFEITPYTPDEFGITIEDPSRNNVIRLRKDSWIAKNPIIDHSEKGSSMHVSINFSKVLTSGQYPTNGGCAKARKDKVQVNYMYGDLTNCAYGVVSKIPYVLYHEEDEILPFDYVALKLNSFPNHDFFIDLVGMNVLHGEKLKFS